jgi:alkanesulfonate monooxygenase SsuD/methylene tetrahydromethanopterin reductase-like flavin-dependent oxidoreductase (luciferase family)
LIGTPEDCARRIVETASLGVRNIYLMPLQSFTLPMAEVRAFGDVVFPRLREAGLRAG